MRSPASTPAPSREDQVALFVLSFITEPQMHLPSKPTSRDRDKSHPSLQDLLIHLSSLVAHPTAVSCPCLLKGCLDGILDFLQLGLRINVAITILDSNTHTQAYTGTYTRTHTQLQSTAHSVTSSPPQSQPSWSGPKFRSLPLQANQ